jgi:hypothetical protein
VTNESEDFKSLFVQQISTLKQDPRTVLTLPTADMSSLRKASADDLATKIDELKAQYNQQKRALKQASLLNRE